MGRRRRVGRYIMGDPIQNAFGGFWQENNSFFNTPLPPRQVIQKRLVGTQVNRFAKKKPVYYSRPIYRKPMTQRRYIQQPRYSPVKNARDSVSLARARIELAKLKREERELDKMEWIERKEALRKAGHTTKEVGRGIVHGAGIVGSKLKDVARSGSMAASKSMYSFSKKKVNLPKYKGDKNVE